MFGFNPALDQDGYAHLIHVVLNACFQGGVVRGAARAYVAAEVFFVDLGCMDGGVGLATGVVDGKGILAQTDDVTTFPAMRPTNKAE